MKGLKVSRVSGSHEFHESHGTLPPGRILTLGHLSILTRAATVRGPSSLVRTVM